ncbi:unnamed protein product [Ilex paraguariensis]
MATTMPKKMSLDGAADTNSGDSLSFTSLVCVQDQYLKSLSGHVLPPPLKNATRTRKEDIEFEFGHSPAGSIAESLDKHSVADVLFSNGQILPQQILFQVNQSQVFGHASAKGLSPPTHCSSRRTTGNESGLSLSAKKPNSEVRNKANKKQSFGQMSSHVLPLPPIRHVSRIQKEDPECEFGHGPPGSLADSLNKNSKADAVFSGGHLLQQGVLFRSNQSQVFGHINSKNLLPSAHGTSRRTSDNELALSRSAKKPNTEMRTKANKEGATGSQWFGQKIFRSLTHPCRDCRAIQPTHSMKERK